MHQELPQASRAPPGRELCIAVGVRTTLRCHPSLLHCCHCKVMCPAVVLSGLVNQGLREEKGNVLIVSAT